MAMRLRCSAVSGSAVLVHLAASLVFGQIPTGTITGTVFDESEAVIRDARIIATNQDTGLQRTASSGAEGIFVLASFPPGTYDVSAEAKGFRTLTIVATVRTGDTTRIDLRLQVGVLEQTVDATDRTPPLDYETHGVKGSVSRFQIENLPLNGREFLRLAILEPGVTSAPSAGFFTRQFDVSILGGPAEQTRTTMDGGPIYGPAAVSTGLKRPQSCRSRRQGLSQPSAGTRYQLYTSF